MGVCVYRHMEDNFIVVEGVPGPLTPSSCVLTARLLCTVHVSYCFFRPLVSNVNEALGPVLSSRARGNSRDFLQP